MRGTFGPRMLLFMATPLPATAAFTSSHIAPMLYSMSPFLSLLYLRDVPINLLSYFNLMIAYVNVSPSKNDSHLETAHRRRLRSQPETCGGDAIIYFRPHRQQETKNSAPICNKINEDIKTDQYSSGKLLRFSVRMLGEGKKMGTERVKDRPHRP